MCVRVRLVAINCSDYKYKKRSGVFHDPNDLITITHFLFLCCSSTTPTKPFGKIQHLVVLQFRALSIYMYGMMENGGGSVGV